VFFADPVAIDCPMTFADGNATVDFNGGLTLGSQSTQPGTGTINLYLTDVINVVGTTNVISGQFNFLNVHVTPPLTPYENVFLGTLVGNALSVSLPPGWQWQIANGFLEVF
jgi:hypothetical protein